MNKVEFHLDLVDAPGVEDGSDWLFELYAKRTLLYGCPSDYNSLLRVNPEKKEAEIVFFKMSKKDPRTLLTREEGLTMEIDDDLLPEHWEALSALPPNPDQPFVEFPFEHDDRGRILFGYATLDVQGIKIPLSHPYPLIDFVSETIEAWAISQLNKEYEDHLARRW